MERRTEEETAETQDQQPRTPVSSKRSASGSARKSPRQSTTPGSVKSGSTSSAKKHSIFESPTPHAPQRVARAKLRDQITKEYRDHIRDLYHQTDHLITFNHESALIDPHEEQIRQLFLGQSYGDPRALRTTQPKSPRLLKSKAELAESRSPRRVVKKNTPTKQLKKSQKEESTSINSDQFSKPDETLNKDENEILDPSQSHEQVVDNQGQDIALDDSINELQKSIDVNEINTNSNHNQSIDTIDEDDPLLLIKHGNHEDELINNEEEEEEEIPEPKSDSDEGIPKHIYQNEDNIPTSISKIVVESNDFLETELEEEIEDAGYELDQENIDITPSTCELLNSIDMDSETEQSHLQSQNEEFKKLEEEARRKSEEEARRKSEEEARKRSEEEARRRSEEEARKRSEEEARRRSEEEARRKSEEEARRRSEEEARRKSEEEARKRSEEEARRRSEEEARRKADEEAHKEEEDQYLPLEDNSFIETQTQTGKALIETPSLPDFFAGEVGKTKYPLPISPFLSPYKSRINPSDPNNQRSSYQVLEISTRHFLYLLSDKYGKNFTKIREIPSKEFDDIKLLGFDYVYFHGIWQLGEFSLNHDKCDPGLRSQYDRILPGWNESDVIGNPMAIYSYVLNQSLGNMDDLKWLRQQINRRGMKLILDYVSNFSAADAPEIQNKNLYIQSPIDRGLDLGRYLSNGIAFARGFNTPIMYFAAQYNLFSYECRQHHIQQLLQLVDLCDGLRCSLAHFSLNEPFSQTWPEELGFYNYSRPDREFWEEAISTIHSKSSDFLMIAESYGNYSQVLTDCGFNYVYDKELLDKFVISDYHGIKSAIPFSECQLKSKLIHFSESPDEPRAVSRFYNNYRMACAASAAMLTLPGLRLINCFQWLGFANPLDIHLLRAAQEDYNPKVVTFFTRLIRVLQMDAVRYGTISQLNVKSKKDENQFIDSILAWKWVKDDERILVVINFTNDWVAGNVVCIDAPTPGSNIEVCDLMFGTHYLRDPYKMRTKGLGLALEPYQVQIFSY